MDIIDPTVVERFWARVEKTETCWIWTGAPNSDGYGTIGRGRKYWLVHRLVLPLTGVELVPGLVIDHLCSNKMCVNPAHLEQVTQAENVARAPHPGPIGQRWSRNGRGAYEKTPCGTAGAYGRGCRCDECRRWQNDRMTEYRRRKRSTLGRALLPPKSTAGV